jgi:hypothetical protein
LLSGVNHSTDPSKKPSRGIDLTLTVTRTGFNPKKASFGAAYSEWLLSAATELFGSDTEEFQTMTIILTGVAL